MNQIAKTQNTSLANFSDGPDPFAAAAAAMGAVQGQFLKFDGNSGDYSYGADANAKDLEHGTQLAVNFTTFKRGFICWKEQKVVEEIMIPILDGNPPAQHALTDHGPYATYADGTKDGWAEQRSLELRSLENGELFVWKATSKSALRSLASILNDFSKTYRTKPGQVPVIELDAVAFEIELGENGQPKKKFKKFAPALKIVGWLPMAEFEELVIEGGGGAPAEGAEGGADDASNYEGSNAQPAKQPDPEPDPEPEVEHIKAPTPNVAPETAATAAPAGGNRRAKRF